MRCKKCEKICKHPRNESWKVHQLCPECFNKPIRELL